MEQLEIEVEDEGGQLNAYTTREETCYFMQTLKNKVQWSVEFLADMLMQSLYTRDHLEAERYTIAEEIYNTRNERSM